MFSTQINDWWGDGSGDMLFIRNGYYKAFEEWAENEPNQYEVTTDEQDDRILTPEQVEIMATQFYSFFCKGKETRNECENCKMFRKECTHSTHRHQS